MRPVAMDLVCTNLEEVNSWACWLLRSRLPAAMAKLGLSSPSLPPHQDWNGFSLGAEGVENEQQEGAGEEKLKAPSHRVCGRNLNQSQLIDEETETRRGAPNREDLSFVKPDSSKTSLLQVGREEEFSLRERIQNSNTKCPWPLQCHPTEGECDEEKSCSGKRQWS